MTKKNIKLQIFNVEPILIKELKTELQIENYDGAYQILDQLSFDCLMWSNVNTQARDCIIDTVIEKRNVELLQLIKHPFCCDNNNQDISDIEPIVAQKISKLQAYDFITPCLNNNFITEGSINEIIIEHGNVSLALYVMKHNFLKLDKEYMTHAILNLFYEKEHLELVKLLESMVVFNTEIVEDCLKAAIYKNNIEGIEYLLEVHTKNTLAIMNNWLHSLMSESVEQFGMNQDNLIHQIKYSSKTPELLLFLWNTLVAHFDIKRDNEAMNFFIQPFLEEHDVKKMYIFLSSIYGTNLPPQFLIESIAKNNPQALIDYEKLRLNEQISNNEENFSKNKIKI